MRFMTSSNIKNTRTAIAAAIARERVLWRRGIVAKMRPTRDLTTLLGGAIQSEPRDRLTSLLRIAKNVRSKTKRRPSKGMLERKHASNAYPIWPQRKTHRTS